MPPRRHDPAETARETVAAASLRFDDSGALASAALARLEWRRARGGKRCEKCREERPLSAFGRDAHEPDGLNRKCRECRRSTRA